MQQICSSLLSFQSRLNSFELRPTFVTHYDRYYAIITTQLKSFTQCEMCVSKRKWKRVGKKNTTQFSLTNILTGHFIRNLDLARIFFPVSDCAQCSPRFLTAVKIYKGFCCFSPSALKCGYFNYHSFHLNSAKSR